MKIYYLLLSLLIFFPVSSFSKTAYINFEKFLSKTNDGKSIEKKLKKEFESRRQSIQKKERKLQEEQMKLRADASLLSESEKGKRLQKMQRQAMEFQKSVEMNQRELDEYKNSLILSVKDKVKPILRKIAKGKDFTIIERTTEKVLWISRELDITNTAIKAYNKRHKRHK